MICRAIPYDGNEPYIFVSYCHKDSAVLYPVFEQMVLDGYRIWYDDANLVGDDWLDNIENHLENCQAVVAFISANSSMSHNCKSEIVYAIKCRKRVIPILIDDSDLPKGLRMLLGSLHYLSLRDYFSFRVLLDKVYESEECKSCRAPAGFLKLREPQEEKPKIIAFPKQDTDHFWKELTPVTPPATPRKDVAVLRDISLHNVNAPDCEPKEENPDLPGTSQDSTAANDEPERNNPNPSKQKVRVRIRKRTASSSYPDPGRDKDPHASEEMLVPAADPEPVSSEEVLQEPPVSNPVEPEIVEPEEPDTPSCEPPLTDELPESVSSEEILQESPVSNPVEPEIVEPEEPDTPSCEPPLTDELPESVSSEEILQESPVSNPVESEIVESEEPDTPSGEPQSPDDAPDSYEPTETAENPIVNLQTVYQRSGDYPESDDDLTIRLLNKNLAILLQPAAGRAYLLRKPQSKIGRSLIKCDIAIEGNASVSKCHAEILQYQNNVYLRDMNSANGTFINGTQMESGQQMQLENPAIFQLSDETLILISGSLARQYESIKQISLVMNEKRTALQLLDLEGLYLNRHNVWPDGTLADAKIHREAHARICLEEDGYHLVNEAPVRGNGTYLNEKRLKNQESCLLHSTDRIRLGSTTLEYISISL